MKTQEKNRHRTGLYLLLIGTLLLAGSASAYMLTVDLSVAPSSVIVSNPVTVYAHVYDADHSVDIPGATVTVAVTPPSGSGTTLTANTKPSGWAGISFTPNVGGTYHFVGSTSVNYNAILSLPAVGIQSATSQNVPLTVTTIVRVSIKPVYPLITTTTSTAITTVQPPTPAVTTASAATTAGTIVVTTAQPFSSADSVPPVTTLTLRGTDDGKGGYSSDVTCTLTASDNSGGSGVSVTQYSFDGATWYTYSQPISVVTTGVTTLYYRSSDKAGNTEVAKVKAIVISRQGTTPAGTSVQNTGTTSAPVSTPLPSVSRAPFPAIMAVLAVSCCVIIEKARKGR